MARNSHCPHIDDNLVDISPAELCNSKKGLPCKNCDANSPNLWICLQKNCLQIGCSDKFNDHSTEHFEHNRSHCIQMNLSSQRVWCYLCECEVFLTNNLSNYNQYKNNINNNMKYRQRNNSIDSNDSIGSGRLYHQHEFYDKGGGAGETYGGQSSEYEYEDDYDELNGLVGLQNIANTCYMNSALQALSNSPPLTRYFLDCGNNAEATSNSSNSLSRTKPGLAKSYHRLIKDMWCARRSHNGYIVPNGILQGIRVVHPMFRGFQQHDTQEFLRCFMDQLHEELKEITPPPPNFDIPLNQTSEDENAEEFSPCPSPTPSQSEAEYETCDSGVSERSSYSDDVSMASNSNLNPKVSRSPSPSQRTNNQPIGYSAVSGSLSHSLNRTNSATSISSQNNQKTKDSASNQPQQKYHRSIISDIFDGKLLSSVQCLTCDRISTREETFQDLSLPIPGKDHLAVLHQTQGISNQANGVTCSDAVYQATQDGWIWWFWNWFRSWFWGPAVSLHDCMAAFFSADELKGDNMYSCEKCNKLRNGVKFSRVLALPEMLCVHLKRFRHDLSYSSKISSPVHFPLTGLDMRPYLHKDCKSKVSSYDLSAVICHHGTVGSGHYICYAKHHPTDKWFEFDDQLVTPVTAETVQNCEAYVLFYQKNNSQMSVIRNQAMELVNNNAYQSSDIKFFVSKQWLNRFNTFAEPGPIDNWSILCPHGNLLPNKAGNSASLVVPLPQTLWDFLYERFGGGPVCNHPFECDTCKIAAEQLMRRQKAELETFTAYRDEFQYQDNTSTLLAISMAWFRKWQSFARSETNEEPGPVNNTTIALQTDNNLPIRNVKSGSDYAQINWKLWKFFHNIYGGGPEIILRGGSELRMEKEMEAENSDVSQHNDNSDSQTNLSSLEQAKLAKESENETKYQQQLQQQQQQKQTENVTNPSILKPTKSVSFEEPTVVNSDEENNNSIENKSLKNEKNIEVTSKKSKFPISTPAIASLEIGVKRDKRNRVVSIKPMFGAEGKYSDYKYTNIPDEITNNNYTNPTNNKTRSTTKSLKNTTKHCADDAHSDSDDDFDSGYPSRKLSETSEDKNKNEVEESLVSPQVVSTHSHSRRKKAKSKYTKKQSAALIANDDSNKRNDNN